MIALAQGLVLGLGPATIAAMIALLTLGRQVASDRRARAEKKTEAERAARDAQATVQLAAAQQVVSQYRELAKDARDALTAANDRNRKSWEEFHAAREADLAVHRGELREAARREREAVEREQECHQERALLEGRVEELETRVSVLTATIRESGLAPRPPPGE